MTTMRGSITPSQVLTAYRHGLFPMARGRFGSIEWFLAEPRTVIPLDHRFHVPRTIKRLIRKTDYRIEINKSFEEVLRACARHNEVGSEEIWLSEEMIQLYLKLHEMGHAHSIEVWTAEGLTGGLYGVALKGAFFGESMFSRTPSSSQIALVALVERLRERNYRLLDTQMRTPHVARFGAIDLTHDEYLALLALAIMEDCAFV